MELKTLYNPNVEGECQRAPIVGFNSVVSEKTVMEVISTNDNALPFRTHFGDMLLNELEPVDDKLVFSVYYDEPINILYTKPTKILTSLKQNFYDGVIGYLVEVPVPGKPSIVRLAGGEMLVEPRTYKWDKESYILAGTTYALACKAGEYNDACLESAKMLLTSRGYDFNHPMDVMFPQEVKDLLRNMDFKAEKAYSVHNNFYTHFKERLDLIEVFIDFGIM